MADRFPQRPIFDTAVTHAVLRRVAAGELPETLRLYQPDDSVVFSLLDSRRPGFRVACQVASDSGCGAVIRLAGGHAALFHPGCLAFSWAIPDARASDHIKQRFESVANWLARAFQRLGVDARVGEVPGEYCPGEYSVNAGGRVKLMGVGQRVIRGAAHIGGVIVVEDSARVRAVLEPIYTALDLDWNPSTAGAVGEECIGAGLDDVRAAILAELSTERSWQPGQLDDPTKELGIELIDWHDPSGSPRAAIRSTAQAPKLAVPHD